MSSAVESQLPELNRRNNVTRKLMNNAENFEKKESLQNVKKQIILKIIFSSLGQVVSFFYLTFSNILKLEYPYEI